MPTHITEIKEPVSVNEANLLESQSTIDCTSSERKTAIKEQDDEIGSDSTTTSSSSLQENNSSWQNPDYFSSSFKEYIFVATCMIANLLNQAGQSQVLSAMNVISDSFHSSTGGQTWLMASFPLVSGSFILISGRLGDIYGLKRMMIGGFIFMIIWSLICGFTNYAHSDTFFIVARAFQGLGISFILPNVMGLVGNIYKVGTLRKNVVISLIGIMAPTGSCFGALWGGLIVTENPKQWPWIFYAYAVAAAVCLVMGYYTVPDNIPTNVNGFTMDWIGSVLGVIGLILFNFVWNQGPIVGWEKAYIIVLLIVSVIFLIAFFVYEIKYAKVPLLPKAVTQNGHILTILTVLFLGWGSFGIWTFYYFAFQLNLREYSPVWSGGTFFVFIIFGTVAATTVALTIKKVGPAILLFFSAIGFTCGSIIMSVTPVHQTYWRNTFGMQIILVFGMDLPFPASSIILSDYLPMQYQGMAVSLVNTIVNYSTSLCLGMGTTVERQINKSGDDLLKGYRAALYFGVGIAGLGACIAFLNVCHDIWSKRNAKDPKDLQRCGTGSNI
ncbi:Atr2p NDAI_0K00400 [Naumovozyma dairenensis CBS 421]|uniref:Major facilitator superfamily (MFS) profile domain-containing protein n=1 Tax=Naumovozyma dairenensis (strain ATCC 10597 / BCRC 20456 / CBS 421 / NBRC 0211 / NRRL Y-12639) TaxID=1071378 RepID=G0WHH0_NAUDC|nr:hypothetical protein NDAI_0K00400 [Naumovozyma dairenensis CBS 421]CCD27231.1 hypothetical protein NDAI_0K00400 [Naumovozyma dairenensis CBS 421]